jgi:hypothetical protein
MTGHGKTGVGPAESQNLSLTGFQPGVVAEKTRDILEILRFCPQLETVGKGLRVPFLD